MRKAAPFAELTREDFDRIIELVSTAFPQDAAGSPRICIETRSTARCEPAAAHAWRR